MALLASMHEQPLHVEQPWYNMLQQQEYHIGSMLHAPLHTATVLCFFCAAVVWRLLCEALQHTACPV